jgi:ABC-type nitrate/sulfonate/bicarbonate transport system permease component
MQPSVVRSRAETAETAQTVVGAARSPPVKRQRWRLDPVPALGVLATIGLWYLASLLIGRYMPPPHEVFANATRNLVASDYFVGLGLPEGGYLPHLLYTSMTVVLGVAIGVALGCLLGLLSARWRVADQITEPVVSIFGTVPILVAAPFFLIWFGLVASAQLILVAFYTTVIMHIYSLQAVRNVHPKYVEFARTLGAASGMIFLRVVLPGAVPEIAGGVRVAFAASWGLAAIAELLGSRYGVGYAILTFESVYDLTSIMTIILLLGLIALVMDWLIGRARAWITRWAESAAA